MIDQKIVQIYGTAVPIRGDDIDTDRIVPSRFLKEITFDNMGGYLFYDSRYGPDSGYGSNGEVLEHPLNDPRYRGANILIVGKNFGCGSSREHAPQAIMRYGIKAIVGESFAEIFAGNCKALGVPTVKTTQHIAQLFDYTEKNSRTIYTIDLNEKTLRHDETEIPIDMPEAIRKAFLEGTWDSLGLLKANAQKVEEVARKLPNFSGI